MALRKLERINYGGKWTVNIKDQNLHSFKKGWFSNVRVSLKWEKEYIYMAQLILQSL